MMIPNLVCVIFDPVIPTSSFNLFNYFFIHVDKGCQKMHTSVMLQLYVLCVD